jgi:SAM-dependent methyltransferase
MAPRRHRASFAEADIALEQTLDELDEHVPNYNEWLRSLVQPATSGRVLEVGAGVGTFTLALLQTADHVIAVEPSDRGSAAIAQTTHGDSRVTVVHGYAMDAEAMGPFDGAVLSNVLEHIEDDEGTLRELRALVRPGGCVAVFSPAFHFLMSDFDHSIGHVRRYRKAELRDRFVQAGFEIVEARYVNVPGFFAWLLVARLLRKRPTHSTLSRVYDRFVVPPTRWIESHIRPPFGQSVLVIGRVPAR